jgi:hypothetical protein
MLWASLFTLPLGLTEPLFVLVYCIRDKITAFTGDFPLELGEGEQHVQGKPPHKAIVDQPLWDKVQAVLAENRVDRTTGSDAKHPSLLAGLAFDDSGERLTPTHAVKKGTRYRYYVSKLLITGTAKPRRYGQRASRWVRLDAFAAKNCQVASTPEQS